MLYRSYHTICMEGKSCNMPESSLVSDNDSIHSSTTTSFSTAFQSIQAPHRQLRRKKTVTQLTRWVSKRISRSSMTDTIRGNELSEQNLKELNKTVHAEADGHITDKSNTDSGTASFVKEHKRTFERIDVIAEEPILKPDLERERELRVRRSYAAFCENFTSSGPVSPKRVFDMTMGMDNGTEKTKQNTIDPSKRSLNEDGDLKSGLPLTHCPQPPSVIMTPSVYKDMQQATREKKRARNQKLLGPFRVFLKA